MTEHTLTQFQAGILLFLILLVVAVVAIAMFWISRRYPGEKRKLDPLYRGVFLVLIVFAFHMTAEVFGLVEQGSVQGALHWYAAALLLAIVFYGAILPYLRSKSIPTPKLWEKYVLPDINHLFSGQLYSGDAYVDGLKFSRTVPSAYSRYLQRYENENTLVEIFVCTVVFNTVFTVLNIRDKFTGESLEIHKNPPASIIVALLGREVARSTSEALSEYDTEQKQEARE